MDTLHLTLILATLLCSLVAGFVFAFAVIVMPGLGTLDDREFLRGFQVVDRVIQNNQPAFLAVWVGSVLALLASAGLGFSQLAGLDRGLLITAVGVYFVGVQLPTATINVPLNNRLQAVEIATANPATLAEARLGFEARWNRWNQIRTVFATATSVLLLVVVMRL